MRGGADNGTYGRQARRCASRIEPCRPTRRRGASDSWILLALLASAWLGGSRGGRGAVALRAAHRRADRVGSVKTPRDSRGKAAKRSPKLPDELLPIVDAVVEVVFERLRTAAKTKVVPLRRKTTKLNLPLPKQRTALAEALADLLLADLASRAGAREKAPGRRKRTARRRGGSPPRAHLTRR